MSSACEEKEAKMDLKNVDDKKDDGDGMDEKSEANAENKTQVAIGANIGPLEGPLDSEESVTTNKVDASEDYHTTAEPGGLKITHAPINPANKNESYTVPEATSVSKESAEQDIIDKITQKETVERDASCNDESKMDTSLLNVITKEPIDTEMTADVPDLDKTISSDDAKIDTPLVTVIKKEPIDTEMTADVPDLDKTISSDDAKIDTPLVTVIKKEPIDTEMTVDVPEAVKTLSTDASEMTEKNKTMSDVVIKVEPIDYDEQPIMSRDGVEILKTENLMSYRQIKTEKDDHDSGTENDSGDESSVVFSDAPVVASDDESEGLTKAFIPKEVPRTKGELHPEDLPPLDELKINLAKDEKLLLMGQVSGIVNTLVVIHSLPATPALNEDSVFFYEDRRVFGRVFEIFGPVAQPFYSIRFNSIEDIQNRKITIGDKVYCAPNLEEITQYIFLDQLKQLKGSDASWKDNNEPPERCLDYSDDESERRSKSKRKGNKEIKEEEEEEESYLDALPGAAGQRPSKPRRRRRQNKQPNDRDRPAPDSFPPSNTNQNNMWNCWPPRGPCPRFTPPPPSNNQMNFRQAPPPAPWHQSQQGPSVHPWQQQSMNQRHFNPQHNFHYQNLPHMNRMPFGNGNPTHQGNPNLFMNNAPAQNNRFNYSQNQNNFNSGPNRNNSFQPVSNSGNTRFAHSGFSQNNTAPQIVDTRFIQNNQPAANTPIHNPYHGGIPK